METTRMNSEVLSYVIQAFGWSLLGIIIGFPLGRIQRALDNGDDEDDGEPVPETRRAHMIRRLGLDRNHLMGWAVLAIATVSLALSGINEASNREFRNHTAHVTACQAEYNEAVVVAIQRRADAAAQDRDTLDNLLKTVATATQSGQVEAALQKYIHDRATADAERARTPLPAPPNCKEVQ